MARGSFDIDDMVHVGEVPWSGISHDFETTPTTTQDIITQANLNWNVASESIRSESFETIPNYSLAYRTDTNAILGLIKKDAPRFVQNIDTFNAFTDLLGSELKPVTASAVGVGEKIFGCFELPDTYKVLGDDIKQYIVIVNDHLKADGKITVINTPVRVACQNALNAAIKKNYSMVRVEVSEDPVVNSNVAKKILELTATSQLQLSAKAENLVANKLSENYVDNLLDELFPIVETSSSEDDKYEKANATQEMMRETFVNNCINAVNLIDFKGTEWGLLQAMLDYTQHYFKKSDDAMSLSFRMNLIGAGVGANSNNSFLSKFMKLKDKIAA